MASAADGKYYVIEGDNGSYKYIKDVKERFKELKKEYDRSIVHEVYTPDPIEHCLHSVKMMIESIIDGCGNGPVRIFLTGEGNFREKIATIKKYKGNRDGMHKPAHLQSCRDYLIRRYNAEVVDGQEADDSMSIEQMKVLNRQKIWDNKYQYFNIDGVNIVIDKEDYDKVKNYNWRFNNYGYVIAYKDNRQYALHRVVMECDVTEIIIDHINHNKLHNTKDNLRPCTKKENCRNSKSINGTSKYKGVIWDKEREIWLASIKVNWVTKFLGRFEIEEEAAKAYDKAAVKYFKEFCYTNFNNKKINYDRPKDSIIASIDKDMDCCPSWHYRWPIHGKEAEKYFIDEVTAFRNFYKQLMVGDSTDNIQGIPGIGKANKALKEVDKLTDEREMAEFVFQKYLEYEKKIYEIVDQDGNIHLDWKKDAIKILAYQKYLENARLVWIRREENEIWTPPKEKKE